MKLAYANPDASSGRDILKQAKESEENDELPAAIASYKRMIKMHYRREFSYQRLMIIYRKMKEYKKEMEIINEAIEEFSKNTFSTKKKSR